MRTSTALLALCSAFTLAAPAQQPQAASGERNRPRIGLVLGGGGARGGAHIGVLRVLEDLRVPIDCIAGTSMGAVVGAAYASGMNSAELGDLVTGIDWSATLGGEGLRGLQSVHRKSAQLEYSNSLEFGIQRGKLVAPGGLIPTQGVESLLRTIVSSARYHDSFDDLPIPFRAVGTDLGSGEMLVLSGGDLSVAMRASMAVPGVFAPVRLDQHVVVDGGLVRNLPVDVAREVCADVVITSSIVDDERDIDQLRSAFAVVGRMFSIVIKNNERAQLASLKPDDVAVLISVPDIGSADFDKTPATIPLGEKAARAVSAQLSRYGVSPEEYARWRASLRQQSESKTTQTKVAAVRIEGLQRVNAEAVRQQIETRAGESYSEERVVADAQRIFAMGDFEKVDYNITDATPDTSRIVQFGPLEKEWGPDYLRFDLGLLYSSGGEASFLLRADHSRRWINALGGEWNNTVQVGRVSLLGTGLFQPLDVRHHFFLEPRLEWKRQQQDLYFGEQRVARYFDTSTDAQLDVGATFGTWGELRFGFKRARTDYTLNTGSPVLQEFHGVNTSAFTSRFVIDTRDSAQLPTRGTYVHLDAFSAEEFLGSAASYQRLQFFGQHVFNIRDRLVYLELAGGTDFDRHTPVYDLFTLGGVGQLAGLQYEELRGHEYAFGRVGHFWKVADLQALRGQALYAGLTLEAGNMFGRIDGSDAQGAIFGSSLFFGGRTPLGPVWIVLGMAEGGRKAAYVQVGRPFEIR